MTDFRCNPCCTFLAVLRQAEFVLLEALKVGLDAALEVPYPHGVCRGVEAHRIFDKSAHESVYARL